jgi:hypothetical protein
LPPAAAAAEEGVEEEEMILCSFKSYTEARIVNIDHTRRHCTNNNQKPT